MKLRITIRPTKEARVDICIKTRDQTDAIFGVQQVRATAAKYLDDLGSGKPRATYGTFTLEYDKDSIRLVPAKAGRRLASAHCNPRHAHAHEPWEKGVPLEQQQEKWGCIIHTPKDPAFRALIEARFKIKPSPMIPGKTKNKSVWYTLDYSVTESGGLLIKKQTARLADGPTASTVED